MSEPILCRAVGCNVLIQPAGFMCMPHWGLVPQPVKSLLAKHGSLDPNAVSPDYIATAFVAISCVALEEGRPLPSLVQGR